MKSEPTVECPFCFGGGCMTCNQAGRMTPKQKSAACADLARDLLQFQESRLRELAAKGEAVVLKAA